MECYFPSLIYLFRSRDRQIVKDKHYKFRMDIKAQMGNFEHKIKLNVLNSIIHDIFSSRIGIF